MKELIIDALSKSYGKTPILDRVDLRFIGGTINGIVGGNGAGKSTLLNCIAGNTSYTGRITRQEISTIGFLPANPYMFPRITGKEFIHFALSAKASRLDEAELDKLNSLFELPLNKFADEYSTGMLKKLHLLVLILQKNDLLLLDEPFDGLDVFSKIYVSGLLRELKRCNNPIIFVSSHDITHLGELADSIAVIENGRVSMETGFAVCNVEKEMEERAKKKWALFYSPKN